jgi:NAD+ kinase
VFGLLKAAGLTPAVCPIYDDGAVPDVSGEFRMTPLESELEGAELIITFGGDGTILHAARATAKTGVPILGINMGDKGFMAELEPEDIELIFKAVNEEYEIDHRMMLDVTLKRKGEAVYTDFALNDIVIVGVARVIELSVFGDGRKITHFSGDGVIVATPTGSTAYSMSAGGPIVEPSAENIIVTPICAHVLIAKSFVLAPERCTTVEIERLSPHPAYLSVDGGTYVNLENGDVIQASKSCLETG